MYPLVETAKTNRVDPKLEALGGRPIPLPRQLA